MSVNVTNPNILTLYTLGAVTFVRVDDGTGRPQRYRFTDVTATAPHVQVAVWREDDGWVEVFTDQSTTVTDLTSAVTAAHHILTH